jgi:hypothetical protein
MKNIKPQSPSIVSVTMLGSKARVVHSTLVDYDAESIACYLYAVTKGTSNYRLNNTYEEVFLIDKTDLNFFDVPVPAIDETQEYVLEIAVVDALTAGATGSGSSIRKLSQEGELLATVSNDLVTYKVESAILLSSPQRFNKSRGAYLREVFVNTPDSITNSAPPYLTFNLVADNLEVTRFSSINLEYASGYDGSTLSGLSWSQMYTGPYQSSISGSTGLIVGTDYVFRVVTTFADNTTTTEYFDSDITTGNINHPLQITKFASEISSPDDFNSMSFEGFTSWDGTPTYELKVSWDWLGNDTGSVRHFEIQLLENNSISNSTNLSSLSWNDAIDYIAAPSSNNLFISAVPLNRKYAFRIRAVGWGSEDTRYSNWLYDKVVLKSSSDGSVNFEVIPSNSTPPVSTNIQVSDVGISAYKDWSLPSQARTFHVDAATGNVSIGGDKLVFDAVNTILSIDGSAIVNDITSANFIMDWVGGESPTLKTATKTDYAQGGSGMWAGYSDNTTFKFDLGDDTKYIRWDGANLNISGGVTIDLPEDVSTLNPGALGYTTLSLSATNNIVLFNGETNTLKEDPVVINLTTNTNGSAAFINDLVWQVLDSDSNDVTSQLLSDQYTNAPQNAKKLTITTANGGLSSYDNLVVRVYYKPGLENWSTSNIKDFTNIGKVKTYDNIVGLEEPYYAYLTNESQPVPVDNEEKNPYLNDATGSMKIYQGTTDLSSSPNTSYTVVSSDGCSVNLSGNTYTVTGIPLSGGIPTKSTYAITLRATYTGGDNPVSYDRVFSLYISKQGAKGETGSTGDTGPEGPEGPRGPDGTTYYTWIRYSTPLYEWVGESAWPVNSDKGSGLKFNFNSPAAKNAVIKLKLNDAEGNVHVALNGTTIENYLVGPDSEDKWFEVRGTLVSGSNELEFFNPVSASADGGHVKTIHVLTAVDNDPVGEMYMGLAYNKLTPTEGTNIFDYQWSKVEGDKGNTGVQGPEGSSLYTWIKYSANANGNPMTDLPQSNTVYIGLAYNKEEEAESSDYTDYSWSRWKGVDGNTGDTGARAPGFFEASTTQNPLNSSVWSGGTASHAYSKLTDLVGTAVAYDMLTLYNSSTPSQTDTKMWNGSSWESAVKINGNIIADGTVGAKAIVADEGFFDDLNVNRIYNHGGSSGNYKMMIDFQNGAIHIRGGN